jgi:hypothetical protein
MSSSDAGFLVAVLITAVVSFFVGALLAQIFPFGSPKPLNDILIAAVGAFAGTTAGAWIALSTDRKKRERETEDRRIEAANVAIFNLAQIYAYQWNYSEQIVKPLRLNTDRWWEISRSVLQPPILEAFDIGRLSFLFDGVNSNLPNLLSIQFQRFQGFLDIVRRAADINQQIQEIARAERKGPLTRDEVPATVFCNNTTKETLVRHTDALIDHNERSTPEVIVAAEALRAAMVKMYPGRSIVKFMPLAVSNPPQRPLGVR